MKNLPNKLLPVKATIGKGNYLDAVIVILVLLWICFLLFTAEKVQAIEPLAFAQAYIKNLGVLLQDKVAFFVWINTHL